MGAGVVISAAMDLDGIGLTSQRSRDRLVDELADMGIRCQPVLEAIRRVPRHIFVDEALAVRSYLNTALPIGYGQTISQPYIVARMLEAMLGGADVTAAEAGRMKVLEVGTGCGYQTAVLAKLVRQVYTVERIATLLHRARTCLRALKLHNVHSAYADGARGWLSYAPYHGIIVAFAPEQVPEALPPQLEERGRLVVPVGGAGRQQLLLMRRWGERFESSELEGVSFVPMRSGLG